MTDSGGSPYARKNDRAASQETAAAITGSSDALTRFLTDYVAKKGWYTTLGIDGEEGVAHNRGGTRRLRDARERYTYFVYRYGVEAVWLLSEEDRALMIDYEYNFKEKRFYYLAFGLRTRDQIVMEQTAIEVTKKTKLYIPRPPGYPHWVDGVSTPILTPPATAPVVLPPGLPPRGLRDFPDPETRPNLPAPLRGNLRDFD